MKKLISRLAKSTILPYLIILAFGIMIFLNIDKKLLFNPDFAQSDIYHGYGVRYFLSENLKNNKLPFWTDMWLGGFPFFSEWQVGSLFLPNLIFYKFLPFAVAINVLIVFVFIMLAVGFYLLLREFEINRWIAVLVSLNFAFNGSLAFRLTHPTVLQTFSFCPILFYIILKFIKTKKYIYLSVVPLVVSQMIFAGFVPVVYMVFIGLVLFISAILIVKLKYNFRKIIPVYFLIGLSLFIGIIVSSPQILPSLSLSNFSTRSLNLDFDTITAFPFSYKNLLNFIFPFAFGNPKEGTYPPYNSEWGIFWENTPFVGPIIIILLFISLAYFFYRKTKDKSFLTINIFIIIFFLLLVLGKYSPLYFLFEFPPFNLFRTQARFLMMVCFFLFIIIGLTINNLYSKIGINAKIFILILLSVNLFNLVSVQKNYHLFVNAEKILEPPKFISHMNNSNSYITLGQIDYWNKVFLKSGWKSETEIEKYLFYRNFLFPNANLLYRKKTYDISNGLGFKPRRNEYIKSLLQNDLINSQDNTFSLQNTKNLMVLLGIKYVITPWEISDATVNKITEIKLDNESIYLYDFIPSNSSQNEIIYSPSTANLIKTLTDFETLYSKNNDFTVNAVIESPLINNIDHKADYKIIKKDITEEKLEITVDLKNKGLIVFRKTFYPGWTIKIDNQVSAIEKINLLHMGAFVSEGVHTIKLTYQNNDFDKGLKIGIFSYGLYTAFLFVLTKYKKRHQQ